MELLALGYGLRATGQLGKKSSDGLPMARYLLPVPFCGQFEATPHL